MTAFPDPVLVAGPVLPPPAGAGSGAAAGADGGALLAGVAIALVLAAIHLFAGSLRSLDSVPRSRTLSLSSGVSVAYVFAHALPELEHAGRAIGSASPVVALLEEHVYVLALLGFVSYYGLEQFVRRSGDGGNVEVGSGLFWLHVGSFAVYNALIGYLLVHPEVPGVGHVALFAVAMGLHFLVNDYGLRDRHGPSYRRRGRWVLAGAVLAGAGVGAAVTFGRGAVAVLFAFLAGGIVLNVIKEELPPERESRFWAFAVGAGGYAALVQI